VVKRAGISKRDECYRRGGALLVVLWLTAALSAIAFSVANTVRGEVERSATAADGVRAYFLARGAVERALLWIQWGDIRNPDGTPRFWATWMRRLHFEFPGGVADVDLIPESARLNVNHIEPAELLRLLAALEVEPARANLITSAILDWRSQPPQGVSEFDLFYGAQSPSFRARHASLEETEEILLVRGMTPELYHGTWRRDAERRLYPIPGLKECLSVYAAGRGQVDINSAQPAVMAAIGVPPDAVLSIVEMRRQLPFRTPDQLAALQPRLGPAGARLGLTTGSMMTIRATARMRYPDGRLSDLRRTVSALVKFGPTTKDAPYHILRWQDQAALGMGDME
jgi:general secretion pathway protein K